MNEILWPEFNVQPPKELGVKRRDVWLRMQAGLYLMATTGWSVVQELMVGLAEKYNIQPAADSLHRIFRLHLFKAGLIHYQVLPHAIKNGLAVVRLTELGKGLCSYWGWPVALSDWEKLIEHHDGDQQLRHTAMVLDFSWQARKMGYEAVVMPNVGKKYTTPDVYIERAGLDKAYVEVERGRNNPEKWRNLYALQGFVAICVSTDARRRKIITEEILTIGIGGFATDLKILKLIVPNNSIWLDRW